MQKERKKESDNYNFGPFLGRVESCKQFLISLVPVISKRKYKGKKIERKSERKEKRENKNRARSKILFLLVILNQIDLF